MSSRPVSGGAIWAGSNSYRGAIGLPCRTLTNVSYPFHRAYNQPFSTRPMSGLSQPMRRSMQTNPETSREEPVDCACGNSHGRL